MRERSSSPSSWEPGISRITHRASFRSYSEYLFVFDMSDSSTQVVDGLLEQVIGQVVELLGGGHLQRQLQDLAGDARDALAGQAQQLHAGVAHQIVGGAGGLERVM